ncbi:hypothetical protein F0A17_14580 [Billgrantia pellis]|uniref:Cell division protein FtsH n=1 Tax=Billgrantia pellis TaxID=2606936 RepID=A0A7V7KGX5_9GAMM|nr:YqjK family protein [Halomonas pellis]KAA0011330.1 hypothetical protein F0A17_14580 [Halomonas pellis]
MTRRHRDLRRARAERKTELIAMIEQQRIDMLVEASRWHQAGRSLDEGWQRLARYRGLLYVAGGALLVGSARRPHSLVRLARRLAAGGFMLNRARLLLRQFR